MPSVMRMPRPIGHGLATVAILGVFTAALCAVTLYRIIAFSMAQRLERAHEAAVEELATLHLQGTDADGASPAMIGMRGGIAVFPEPVGARAPADWRAPLAAAGERALGEQGAIDIETPIPGAVLVARVEPMAVALGAPAGAGTRLGWVAVAIKPSTYSQSWRLLVSALTLSALLLVASSALALTTFKRGASGIQTALAALANDLATPVPRPPVRELSEIADGIATLARRLAEARAIQERLGRDLAQKERLVALGRVVAGVAHEVRNPLASIKLRLDLAMAGDAAFEAAAGGNGSAALAHRASSTSLPPKVVQAIAHASAEITRLDRLVADLLIVSGRALGPRHPTDVGALLRSRVEALAPWSALRGVTIRTAGGGASVPADGDAMARALDNLLRNAIEASPDNGTIAATVYDDGAAIRVRVQDTGGGVPAGRVGELFEPFFTTKPEGTGLGLAISRAIARAHGGDVIYAREGDVTRFELSLARTAAAPAEEPRA
jgi:signal transduction histidine kinase